jgi:hypothetical protein
VAARDDDFAFVLAAVRRLLDQTTADIEGLVPRDMPADSEEASRDRRGEVLADHALDALTAIRRRVDDVEARFPKTTRDAVKRTAADDLRFYAHLAWGTHHVLQWLQSGENGLDLGALYFADEVALTLLGPGVEINPVESNDYMYSTSIWPLNWLVHKLGESVPKKKRPMPIVLAFPARERSTMLFHCIFAHELSHAAVRENDLVDRGLEPLKEGGEYDAWLKEARDRSGNLGTVTALLAPPYTRAWIDELFCDALAFAVLGPAYLFAFAEMALSTGWSEPDKEHPSTATRTRQLVRLAERYGWSEFLQDRLPRIWEWFELAGAAPSKSKDQGEAFAERVCRNSFDRIAELVDETMDEKHFTPAQWEKHEEHLAELLENDILPVEADDGNPVSHPEILNASWLQALAKYENTPSAISKAIGESDYQRFVAKALEMSTILRLWNQEDQGDPAAA